MTAYLESSQLGGCGESTSGSWEEHAEEVGCEQESLSGAFGRGLRPV